MACIPYTLEHKFHNHTFLISHGASKKGIGFRALKSCCCGDRGMHYECTLYDHVSFPLFIALQSAWLGVASLWNPIPLSWLVGIARCTFHLVCPCVLANQSPLTISWHSAVSEIVRPPWPCHGNELAFWHAQNTSIPVPRFANRWSRAIIAPHGWSME